LGDKYIGMFDTVVFSMPCPFCQEIIPDFQSKDGDCILGSLKPHEVRNFYSSCPKCNAWVSCSYIPPQGTGKIVAVASIPEGATHATKEVTVELEYNEKTI
jgi:hypothetical protein